MKRSIALLSLAALAMLPPGAALGHDDDETAPKAFTFSTGDGASLFTSWHSGPRLGVGVEEETEHPEGGARVNNVVDDSAADEAGIRSGDIIVAVGGEPVRGPGGLTRRLGDHEEGDSVTIEILRDGKRESLTAELTAPPRPRALIAPRTGRGFNYFIGGRPKLGVQLIELTPELREHLGGGDNGVLVSRVLPGTPAEHGGLLVGDLIVAVDGESIDDAGALQRAVSKLDGEEVDIEILRDGRATTLRVAFPEPDDRFPTGPRAALDGDFPYAVAAPAPIVAPRPAAPARAESVRTAPAAPTPPTAVIAPVNRGFSVAPAPSPPARMELPAEVRVRNIREI